jgi:hypothetical protein
VVAISFCGEVNQSRAVVTVLWAEHR